MKDLFDLNNVGAEEDAPQHPPVSFVTWLSATVLVATLFGAAALMPVVGIQQAIDKGCPVMDQSRVMV